VMGSAICFISWNSLTWLLFLCFLLVTARPPPKNVHANPPPQCFADGSYEVPSQTTDAQQLLSSPKAAEGRCFLVSLLLLGLRQQGLLMLKGAKCHHCG
jgi:hypothetical protein